jgi:hypothetical protein
LDFNKLCNIEYIGDEPNKDSIIFSCSLFKLNDMYRDITVYVDGLRALIDYIDKLNRKTDLDIYLFLYYDNSVDNDSKFVKIKNYCAILPFIRLCKYECPSFIKNSLHLGVFGTFVRFLPFFEEKYKQNLKHIVDIDLSESEKNYYFKYALPKVVKSSNKCIVFQKIGYEWKYANQYKNKFIDGTCIANIFLKNMCLPIHLLTNFIEKLRDNNSKLRKTVENMLQKREEQQITKGDVLKNIDINRYKNPGHLFIYGVDELFVNVYVLNYIIKIIKEIGIIYIGDNLKYYVNDMIDWKKTPRKDAILFLKAMLHNKYNGDKGDKDDKDDNENKDTKESEKLFKTNINLLSNKIIFYNVDTVEKYKAKITYLDFFYKKLLEFKSKLIIDKDFLSNLEKHFYTKYQVNFLLLDYKEIIDYIGPRLEIYSKHL